MAQEPDLIPCPFVYARGRKCTGHINKIEAYKADIAWERRDDGSWSFSFEPRSHYHLFCSEKGNHAGYLKDDALKFYPGDLPQGAVSVIFQTRLPRTPNQA